MGNVIYAVDSITINLGERKLKIMKKLLQDMCKYRQNSIFDKEAGGILVGRENRSNYNLVIEFITEPMKKDKRTRCKYLRCDEGHIKHFQEEYEKSGRIYAYLGEWHTHPEDNPNYSRADLNNWKQISKIIGNRVQYQIIVGRKVIKIWSYDGLTKLVDKKCEILVERIV